MNILIAAIITVAAAAGAYGYLIRHLSEPADRRAIVAAVLFTLPLQPLAFYLVRLPLDAGLRQLLGTGDLYAFLTTFYAPLTEEPAKWLVLLVPLVLRTLRPASAAPLALAAGLGFGLGEIGFLAERLMRMPEIAAMPFWMFGGFLTERFVVCFLHGAFVFFLFARLAAGKSFWPGAIVGMALHYITNFPIYFASLGALPWSAETWQMVLAVYVLALALVLAAVMNRMVGGRLSTAALGYSECPECGANYPRPFLALNLGPVRYERCPSCRKFHLVRIGGKRRLPEG
jgi:hypothetical protein